MFNGISRRSCSSQRQEDIISIMSKKTIDIKLIKSSIGRLPNHKKCVNGLGFRKLQQTVTVEDTPSNRGMINKIRDMLIVKES